MPHPSSLHDRREALARVTARALDAVLEVLSPTRCAGCERPGTLICDACFERLPLIDPVHACLRCGAPFGDVLCTECAPRADAPVQAIVSGAARAQGAVLPSDPPQPGDDALGATRALPPGRCLATASFDGPLPRIIRAYKDAGEFRLASVIAQMLADTLAHAEDAAPARYGGIVSDAESIVFVPATASAYARRGFDHMEAIARALAEEAGPPVLDALVKRGSADQRALGRAARARGVRGIFEVVEDVAGRRVLLIDDVITTGSTVRAAAAALHRAGAARVDVLALARVW